MQGVLNIQVRVMSAQAKAMLKQLEKEIMAVDRATSGQGTATRRLATAQEHARNTARSLSAAQKELAASQKAGTAAARAREVAINSVSKAELAYQKALVASSSASAKKAALDAQAPAATAAAARATEAHTRAMGAQTVATNRVKDARLRLARINQQVTASERADGVPQALRDKQIMAERRLEGALVSRGRAQREVIRTSTLSADAEAKAAASAAKLAAAHQNLVLAQQNAARAAAELTAAHARVGATEAEIAAAAQRAAIAQNQLTAATERQTVASAALAKAQAAAAASTGRLGAAGAAAASGGLLAATGAITKFANRAQWAGRQMQSNFTLPILLAGGFAVKFALDNEKAMVKLSKVYGSNPTKNYKEELDALGESMELLSVKFGIQQKNVLEVGAAWAAAGAEGVALAKGVEQTLRTMVVGDMEAEEATKALISIQAQWGLATGKNKKDVMTLTDTMEMLNAVENQTGTNLKDLVDAYARASGSAKNAGVTQRELAAAVAALVPAAGSAANAGNGLKTIYSRLLAPTREAVQVLGEMGIQTDSSNWKNLTAAQRLEVLAEQYKGMDKAARGAASAVLMGRWQLTRAEVVLDAITNKNSYYQKALDVTADKSMVTAIAQRELAAVLESNPQKLKTLGVILQNVAADLGVVLLPAVMAVAAIFVALGKAFGNLNPIVQKAIAAFLVMIALTGPIIRWGMGVIVLGGYMIKMFQGLAVAVLFAGKMILLTLVAPLRILAAVILGTIARIVTLSVVTRALPAAFAAARVAVLAFIATLKALVVAGMVWRTLGVFAAAGIAGMIAVLKGGLLRAGALLLGWPGLIAIAVVALFVIFKDKIANIFSALADTVRDNGSQIGAAFAPLVGFFQKVGDGIQSAFNKLPAGIQSAMLAVVKIIAAAARKVQELFSYFNPFARHSPSLVENVTNGMKKVRNEFASIKSISNPIKKAYSDIKKFKQVTSDLMKGFDSVQRLEQFKALMKVDPGSGKMFKVLVNDLKMLEPLMVRYENRVNKQEQVVEKWNRAVERSNQRLDEQKEKLQRLEDKAQKYADKLSEAQAELQEFASTPIAGMRKMENAIFANQQAQKRLQLEMMNMEDAVGPIDDLQQRMSALNGEIEVLKGAQASLRDAGAGSDVLGVYNQQIAALESQQSAITDTASEYNAMKSEMEALQREAQRLDLTKSLNFDGLQRQIAAAVDGMKELPFNEIMKGISNSKQEIDKYQQAVDRANQKIDRQQKIVDSAQKAHEKLVSRYEEEQQQLDKLNQKYEKYRDAINEVKSALDAVNQAATGVEKKKGAKGGGAGDYVTPGLQNYRDALGGDFPVEGGKAGIGREGGLADIEKFNADLGKELQGLTQSLDIFAPIKKYWNKFTGWWNEKVTPGFKSLFKEMVPGTDILSPLTGSKLQYQDTPFYSSIKDFGASIGDAFKSDSAKKVGDTFVNIFNKAAGIVRLFLPDLKDLVDIVKDSLVKAWKTWFPEIKKLSEAVFRLAKLVGGMFLVILAALLPIIKVLAGMFTEVLGRALDFVIDIIGDVLRVITGLINFVIGLITGDWALAWKGLKDIVGGAFEAIWHIIEGAVSIVYGILKGFVEGIIGFFVWLWDELVGNSIIPDMIDAIVDWFKSMPKMILKGIGNLIKLLLQKGKDLLQGLWNGIKWYWTTVKDFYSGLGKKILQLIGNVASTLYNKGKDLLQGLWNGIKWYWTTVKDFYSGLGKKILQLIGNVASTLYNKGKDLLQGLWNGIKWYWTTVKDFYSGLGKKILQLIGNVASTLYNKGKDLLQGLWNGIKWYWTTVKEFYQTLGSKIKDAIGNIASTLYNKGKDFLQGLWNGIKFVWTSIGIWIRNKVDWVVEKFSGIKDRLKNTFTGMFDGIKNAFRSVMNWVIDKWNGLNFKIGIPEKAFGIPIPGGGKSIEIGTPDIPRFAKGGRARAGLPHIVGEIGPELFVPERSGRVVSNKDLNKLVQMAIQESLSNLPRADLATAFRNPSPRQLDRMAAGADRRLSVATAPTRTVQNNTIHNNTEYHFHGDLSFPSVQSGEDAQEFLTNLETLARK